MEITIKYLGVLAEEVGCSEEKMDVESQSVAELLALLDRRHTGLKKHTFKVALNQTMVNKNEKIKAGELALLPPFSGG